MAGYSGTPLIQKIGIKPGHRIVLRNHPASFVKDLGKLPEGAESTDRLSGKANVVVYFTERLVGLEKDFPRRSGARWHAVDRLAEKSQRTSHGPDRRRRTPGRAGVRLGGREGLRHR